MGLFINLKPTSQEKKKLSKNIKNIPLFSSFHLQIQVIQKEEILEEIQFERYYLDPDTNYHEVQFKQAIGRLFCRKMVELKKPKTSLSYYQIMASPV